MKNIYTIASTSSSVTYGNISCAIRELLLSKFPYNFFNYINISSEIAFRNIRRQLGPNTLNEFSKRRKPYLIIRPVYSVGNSDLFLNDIPLTKNFDDIQYGMDKRYLFPIYVDRENGIGLRYKLNRDKIDFDITITVSTLHQQIDVYKALINQIVWERPYSHSTSLEALIPRSMISYLGKVINMDIDNPSLNQIPVLLRRLNTLSNYPITYKIRNSSSLDEFFMYYNHNIIVTFTDLSLEDGNKKNMVDESYNITFRVSAEFNLPGLFILDGEKPKPQTFNMNLVNTTNDGSQEFIPLFTLNNFYNQYPSIMEGFKLYTTSIFNVEENPTHKDYLDISPLFEDDIIRIIKENVSYNSPIDTVLKIIILKDNERMVYGTQYNIDFNTMNVEILDVDKTSTYRIIIYINNIHVNSRLIELIDNEKVDKPEI